MLQGIGLLQFKKISLLKRPIEQSIVASLGGALSSSLYPTPSFQATLQTTLVPEFGSGSLTPTFSRATTAYVQDWEGIYWLVLSGESKFTGARRVANLIPAAGTGSASLANGAN